MRGAKGFEGKYAAAHTRFVDQFKRWLKDSGPRSQNEQTRAMYGHRLCR